MIARLLRREAPFKQITPEGKDPPWLADPDSDVKADAYWTVRALIAAQSRARSGNGLVPSEYAGEVLSCVFAFLKANTSDEDFKRLATTAGLIALDELGTLNIDAITETQARNEEGPASTGPSNG